MHHLKGKVSSYLVISRVKLTLIREVESLLDKSECGAVRRLLDDDDFLHIKVISAIESCQGRLRRIISAIDTVTIIQSYLNSKNKCSWPDLYAKSMLGELNESPFVKEILLFVRKMPSHTLQELLSRLKEIPLLDLQSEAQDLQALISSSGGNENPLRSEHDAHRQTLRATVVAQKVELSKHSSSLSKKELDYSKVINRVDAALREFFQTHSVDFRSMFLHEIVVYDFKSPHRDTFLSKPRYAIERALSSPHDYLGCSCCNGAEQTLSASQPATAILYQLYLESGAIINVADLWSAFHTIVARENVDEGIERKRVLLVA